MIEDDDSKIRRNLLVFSVLVILAEWFDLQLGEMVADVLKLNTKLDALKLCAAALATLVYLGLRYKDADLLDGKKYRDVVDRDLAVITPRVVYHYAQFMARLYTWTGFEASVFLGHLKTHIKQRSRGMDMSSEELKDRPKIRLSTTVQDEIGQPKVMQATGPWEMSTLLVWGNSKYVNGGTLLAVEANGVHQYLIWAYSRVWWFLFCEAAVRARFPVLFGLAAVAILCAKVSTLLAHK